MRVPKLRPPQSRIAASVLLPPEVAPSDDLTWKAGRGGFVSSSPFDSDPVFDRLFDQLARALHRRQSLHALMGERGNGPSVKAVLPELLSSRSE